MTGWDEKMGELRRRFLDRTIADGGLLKAGPLDRDQLEAIAHRISGSAALFGYADLGTAAGALEEAYREGCDDIALALHIERLCRAIDRLQAP